MSLLVVVLILIVWAIYGIVQGLTPSNPQIDDMAEHLKTIQSLPNQKARQKYSRNMARKSNK